MEECDGRSPAQRGHTADTAPLPSPDLSRVPAVPGEHGRPLRLLGA